MPRAPSDRIAIRRLTITLALTLPLAAAFPLGAQPPLRPGARVRVRRAADTAAATPAEWRIGTVVSSTREALVLRPAALADSVVVPMSEIRRIDISLGRPSHRTSGAVIGALLSGAAFVGLACAFSDGSCSIGGNVGGFLGYYAVGAVPGAFVGAALGARHPGRERWRQVVGATIGPTTGIRRSSSADANVAIAESPKMAAALTATPACHGTTTYATAMMTGWCTRYQP